MVSNSGSQLVSKDNKWQGPQRKSKYIITILLYSAIPEVLTFKIISLL
jgi:hypothetical protein